MKGPNKCCDCRLSLVREDFGFTHAICFSCLGQPFVCGLCFDVHLAWHELKGDLLAYDDPPLGVPPFWVKRMRSMKPRNT